MAVDPAKFVREVRSEMARVTWPSRKETMVTTGLVFAMVALAAAFFFLVDQFIGIGIRARRTTSCIVGDDRDIEHNARRGNIIGNGDHLSTRPTVKIVWTGAW